MTWKVPSVKPHKPTLNKSLDWERQNGTAPDSQEATLEKHPGFPLPEKLCGFSEPKLGAGFGLLFTNTRPWRALWLPVGQGRNCKTRNVLGPRRKVGDAGAARHAEEV